MCWDPSASSSVGKSTEHLKSWTKVSQRWTCAGNVPTEVRRFTMYWGQCVNTCAAALCGSFHELHLWQVVMKCKPHLENHCNAIDMNGVFCCMSSTLQLTTTLSAFSHVYQIFFLWIRRWDTKYSLFFWFCLIKFSHSRPQTHTHTHAQSQS